MPLAREGRSGIGTFTFTVVSLGVVLVVGLVTLTASRHDEASALLETSEPSSLKRHLHHVRQRQAVLNEQNVNLLKRFKSQDRSVQAMLTGDHFTAGLQPAAAPAQKTPMKQQHPKAAATTTPPRTKYLARATHHASVPASTGQKQKLGKQAKLLQEEQQESAIHLALRREQLLRAAEDQLWKDTEGIAAELAQGSGSQAWMDEARAKVLGDKRLVSILTAWKEQAAAQALKDAKQHAEHKPRPQVVTGEVHVADVLDGSSQALNAAGVKTEANLDDWLNGMHKTHDDGDLKLRTAGVATDRLPGLGEDYARAIPLPTFHDDVNEKRVKHSLEAGHRPLTSAGERMVRDLGINVASPNLFVYGTQDAGTPSADRTTTMFHYADGLEDAATPAAKARQHRPLSFVLHDIHRGSEPMERAKVNVWGTDVLNDLLPTDGPSWENPVPVEHIHHPLVDGEMPETCSGPSCT